METRIWLESEGQSTRESCEAGPAQLTVKPGRAPPGRSHAEIMWTDKTARDVFEKLIFILYS